ncbi:hypothetical protein GF367_00885 [Candidatus Woesearchaeota archaeon]|nr:hypothetical protein [Candidatus Woesearchaeota archaeon]
MVRARKGVELSVNMMVTVVIGIVLLGIGIFIVTKIVDKGIEITGDVDEQLKEQLRKTQFREGRQVAVLNPHERVKPGESAYFLLGFVNTGNTVKNFTVYVQESDRSPTAFSGTGYVVYSSEQVTLQPKDDHFQWILFTTKNTTGGRLPGGEYFYDVCVHDGETSSACDSDTLHGNKQRLFITVG